jgi:hypothetical protein
MNNSGDGDGAATGAAAASAHDTTPLVSRGSVDSDTGTATAAARASMTWGGTRRQARQLDWRGGPWGEGLARARARKRRVNEGNTIVYLTVIPACIRGSTPSFSSPAFQTPVRIGHG